MTLPLFAEDHSYIYAGHKSRLRTKRVALVTTGPSCGQADLECCSTNRGRLETTRVLFWLKRKAEDH